MATNEEDTLKQDTPLSQSISKLSQRLDAVQDVLNSCLQKDMYSSATSEERVKYDLFLSFTVSALFWAYLRTVGVDPQKHPLRQEVDRVRSYMAKAKAAHDRIKLRPRLDKPASKRFIKHGLWTPTDKEENLAGGKKKKFE